MATDVPELLIEIHQSPSGSYFVWICEMVFALRTKHRIYGRLVGTLPRCPHQNSCLGLPLLLSNEEVNVARKQDDVKVFKNSSVQDKPAAQSAVEEYLQQMKIHYREMNEILHSRKKLEMVRNYHKIRKGLGKRQSRLLKRKSTGTPISDEELNLCDPDSNFTIDDVRLPDIPDEKIVSHLPSATPSSWLREGETEDFTGAEKELTQHCRVFEDLWKRGHHVTVSSAKMGGDFLIYPGDPLRFHASHIVVLSSSTKSYSANDITSLLRLASSVKKIIVLADDKVDQIEYTTISWAGVG